MARDHQRFVGWNDLHRDAASWRTEACSILGVSCRIEFHSQPGGSVTDSLAYPYAVLADTGREYQGIQPAEGGGKRAELPTDAINEQLDGKLGALLH